MKRMLVTLAMIMAGTASVLAFDAATGAVIERNKVGKPVTIDDIGDLMMGAERWCYNQQDNNCAWSDVYLSVTDDGATYEISNPWSDTVDIAFVSEGIFRDGRYICENAFDWIPSVRAYSREDGWALEGRALATLKEEIAGIVDIEADHACFDYVYRGQDEAAQTITLLQRHYERAGGEVLGEDTVTLHFDNVTAEALGWYW